MNVRLSYDKDSDTLQIDWCEPYSEQDSRSIEQGVLARLNPDTRAVESLEILDFYTRFGGSIPLELPLLGTLQLRTG
jgi:hypothetical protein